MGQDMPVPFAELGGLERTVAKAVSSISGRLPTKYVAGYE
jgi:hypothetical protein